MLEQKITGAFASDLETLCRDEGYRVVQISPADEPTAAVLSRRDHLLTLMAAGANTKLRPATAPPVMPPSTPAVEVTRVSDSPDWSEGRAGMAYRDLVPTRQGGRVIASHIRIAKGGPVADYVHFHNVCFQMIYVLSGWVRVVYEDQGPAFVMSVGDCVLQPPHIRHQVLESSDGLDVIEITAPAGHDTFGDLHMTLPTKVTAPDRDFGGQHFWHHRASEAVWNDSSYQGFEQSDLGLGNASGGVAEVCLHRSGAAAQTDPVHAGGESRLLIVLDGSLDLGLEESIHSLSAGDCAAIPGADAHRLCAPGPTSFLSVSFLGLG